MKNAIYFLGLILIAAMICIRCKKSDEKDQEQSIITGTATIVLDESLMPVVEDVASVFENEYKADIQLVPTSEAEAVNDLMNQRVGIAILSRSLDSSEIRSFENKNIFPRITKFASDGVALISNKANTDSIIDINAIKRFIIGEKVSGINGLVLDNLNSGAARLLMNIANTSKLPDNVYSFKTNREVINYVANNQGMVGVVGVNWLSQAPDEVSESLLKVKVLKVGNASGEYVKPTQDNLAQGKYPLARDLFLVNCQGFQGLGMGFASFIAGERGQRIILKSGLLPVRIPGRKITTRSEIIKKTNN